MVYIQLWVFLKNSPKNLNIYAKTSLKMLCLDTLPTKKHKKLVREVKKANSSRWLSFYASVDRVYHEYVGLFETLNLLMQEKGPREAQAKGFC